MIILLWILKDLNVLPENTYFVGDGETDVMVANNAELKGIAALWGYRDKEILEQCIEIKKLLVSSINTAKSKAD